MHANRCPNCFAPTPERPCPTCGWRPGQDNEAPFLPLGTGLDGRYRVGRVLGHGGFGITYLAWDENLELALAVKEYLPQDCATRGADGATISVYSSRGEEYDYGLARFIDEACALARFDQHPGVVGIKNFFRAHGTGYIVMDFVPGITLKDYLDRQGGRILGCRNLPETRLPSFPVSDPRTLRPAARDSHTEARRHGDTEKRKREACPRIT